MFRPFLSSQRTQGCPRWVLALLLCFHPVVSGATQLVEPFGKGSVIQLSGPWEVYWGQFVPPQALADGSGPGSTARQRLPGSWTRIEHEGKPLPPTGYATYRLRVKIAAPRPDKLMLRVPSIYSTYRLFINGEPAATVGEPGTGPETSIPDYGERLIPIAAPGPEIDLVFHVSNYSSRTAGFARNLQLGTPEGVAARTSLRVVSHAAMAGALVLLGLSQLILFALRRKEKAYLFFGLGVTAWGLQTGLTGQIFTHAGWHLPIWLSRPLDGFTVLASGAMYLLFISALFPRDLPLRYSRWALVIPLIYLGFAFFASDLSRSIAAGWLLYLIVGLLSLGLLAPVRAWRRGDADSGIFLLGGVAVAVTTILQAYWYNQTGVRETTAGIGVFVTVSLHSITLARRYARAFARSQQLEVALRRANRLKDEFLANTSHELRTPLHAMIGLAESPPQGDGSIGRTLKLIAASGHRLTRLVDNILDFTRLKYDDLPFEPKATRIEPLIHGVLATCQPLIGARPVILQTDIEESLPAVKGDPDRLHQVLFNLVGNAIKFTDRGHVSVRASRSPAGVRVEVADTGIGMLASDWERLQQPYEQAETPDGGQRGGVGLGLAITRRILELHGSKMQVDSETGQGSRIHFELPPANDSTPALMVAESTGTTPEPLSAPETRQPAGGPHILVVDDDDGAAAVLEQQLTLAGYSAERAASGTAALEAVARVKPDLVMLDVMMPDMSGLTVCRHLREEFDATTLPVILVTARTRPEDIVQGLNAGANDYLAKPFYRVEMLARVEAQLRVGENEQMRWALSEQTAGTRDPKQILAELLGKSVKYWELKTGLARADLAERSGLWTVTLDGSARKTRTLDRYLSIDRLPKRPRWGIVTRTARYVIDHLDCTEQISELEALVAQLHASLER